MSPPLQVPNEAEGRRYREHSHHGHSSNGGNHSGEHHHRLHHHGGHSSHHRGHHHHGHGHGGRRGHLSHHQHNPHQLSSRTLQSVVEDIPLDDGVEVAEVDDGGLRVRTLPRIEAVPPVMMAKRGSGTEQTGGKTSLREAMTHGASSLEFLSPLCSADPPSSESDLYGSCSSLYSEQSSYVTDEGSSVPSLPSLDRMVHTADFRQGGDAFSVLSGNSKSTDASSLASSARRIKSERAADDIGRLMNLFGVSEGENEGDDVLGVVPKEASEALSWSAARVRGDKQNIVSGTNSSRRSVGSKQGRTPTDNPSKTTGQKVKSSSKPRDKAVSVGRDKPPSLSPTPKPAPEDSISTSSPKGPDDEGSPEDASACNFIQSLKEIQELYKEKPDKNMTNLRRIGDKYGLRNDQLDQEEALAQVPKILSRVIDPNNAAAKERGNNAHHRSESAGNDSMSTLTDAPSKGVTNLPSRDRRALLGVIKQHVRNGSEGSADNPLKVMASLRRIGDLFDLNPDDNTTAVTALGSLLRSRCAGSSDSGGKDGEKEEVEHLLKDLRHLGAIYGIDVDDELSTLDGYGRHTMMPTDANSKSAAATTAIRSTAGTSNISPHQLLQTLSIPSAPAKHGVIRSSSISASVSPAKKGTNIQSLREKYGISQTTAKSKAAATDVYGSRKDLIFNSASEEEAAIRQLQDRLLTRLVQMGEKQGFTGDIGDGSIAVPWGGDSRQGIKHEVHGRGSGKDSKHQHDTARSGRSLLNRASIDDTKQSSRSATKCASQSFSGVLTATTAAGSSRRSETSSSTGISSHRTGSKSDRAVVGRTTGVVSGKQGRHALASVGKSCRGR